MRYSGSDYNVPREAIFISSLFHSWFLSYLISDGTICTYGVDLITTVGRMVSLDAKTYVKPSNNTIM